LKDLREMKFFNDKIHIIRDPVPDFAFLIFNFAFYELWCL